MMSGEVRIKDLAGPLSPLLLPGVFEERIHLWHWTPIRLYSWGGVETQLVLVSDSRDSPDPSTSDSILLYYLSIVFLRDVWKSSDKGSSWTLINASPVWPPRYQLVTIALDSSTIILMGGRDVTTYLNDVWKSTDQGLTWSLVSAAGWSIRTGHTSVALDSKSIVTMGGLYSTSTFPLCLMTSFFINIYLVESFFTCLFINL
jgi:hypothetical protein